MSSKIVLAKDLFSGKVRQFLEYKTETETTYRNFKVRIRRWGRKYGTYNTIKREAGEATFIDGGKLKYNVEIIDIIKELDHRNVGVGYSSVDNQ
jgi:hypothetical protein